MTNQELNDKLISMAAQERKMTKEILWHIAEVDKRKLFLQYSYPSLFSYLTEAIGYSEGAAQRRIDGARMLRQIPEISDAIERGTIHLGQVSKLQRLNRQIKKTTGTPVQVILQKSILKKIENKTAAQTDLILAKELNVKVETSSKKKIQQDESVRLELTFSKEEMQLIEKARELLSNKTGGDLKETLVEMARKLIKDAAPKTKSTATVAVKTTNKPPLKSVTPRLKQTILHRDQVCQFKDHATGRICGSKFFLEVDHIRPKFLNGPNTEENLRALCKNHNQYRYSKNLCVI